MTDMPSSPSEWADQPGPGHEHSGSANHQLTTRSQTADSDGPRSDRRPEGEPDARDHAGSGVPDLEGLRRMQFQLAAATVTSAISPKVSAVVGTHLKTLIDSDPSMRGSRGSSAAAGDTNAGNGTAGPAEDRPQCGLSDEAISRLLETVLSCDPAAMHVLQPFLKPQHIERIRTFYAGTS